MNAVLLCHSHKTERGIARVIFLPFWSIYVSNLVHRLRSGDICLPALHAEREGERENGRGREREREREREGEGRNYILA